MGGFFSSLFSGSSPGVSQAQRNAAGVSTDATALGFGDTRAASDFERTLLSGDPTAIGRVLGPQISAINKQGNEAIQTRSQFGNRSGGTNAANQQSMDEQRANVERMISQLTGGAAGELATIGTAEQGIGLSANEQAAHDAQVQLQNIQNSLFGKMISSGIGAAESFALGKIPGIGAGGGGGGGGGGTGETWSDMGSQLGI